MQKRLPILALAATGLLHGQAALLGVLTDPSGLPVPAAAIELRREATHLAFRTSSNERGSYYLPAVPAGSYTLLISKPGFQALRREGIILRTGDRIALDLALQVGEVSDTVVVSAEAPLLKTSTGTVSLVVDGHKATSLPLDGRNFVPLIALSPGVNLPPGSVFPRINGGRPRVSEYLYDGVSVLQPEPGQVAYLPVIDAIDEFRVETNSYSAEYGRANGGVILVTQRSGGNDLHGTLFEFVRNEVLNARNLFAPAGDKPRFRRNQYGFVLGGPVRRNRTFFFTDWQGTRQQTGVVRVSTVPTLAQRSGVFASLIRDPGTRTPFPGNVIPESKIDPVAKGLLTRYPAPASAGESNNFQRVGNEQIRQDQFDARIDHVLSARHRIFGRYAFLRDESKPVSPLPDGSGAIASGVVGDTLTRADSLAAEHSWTISPDTVSQVRFGYTRRRFDRNSMRTGFSGVPNLPRSAFPDTLPTFEVTGYQSLGPPANGNAEAETSVTQLQTTFTWIAGRNSVKAGSDLRRQTLDILQPPSPTGLFQFNSVLTGNSFASFLLGQVQSFQIDQQPEVLGPRASIAEFFVQDDFRASRRLSMNLGVRYTLNFPSTVAGDRGAVFNLDTQRLNFLGRNGFPRSARSLEWGNFGPRVGLSYLVTPSLVGRAGYGMTWIEQAGITTPFTTPMFPFIRTLQQRSQDNLSAAFQLSDGPSIAAGPIDENSGLGQGVFAVQRNQKSGYAQQWNLTIQKTLGEHWSVEAGYLGSKLTNLGVPDVNINQLPAPLLALGSQLTEQVGGVTRQQLLRPYPRFATIALYRNNVGHSTYHSGQVRVEKRFAKGFSFTAAYTFSRLIDDAGAVFDAAILTGPPINFQAADSYNRRLEKDVSTGNIPHVFSGGIVWSPPRGWQMSGIVRAQAGSPVAVIQQPNLNAFAGFGIQRPNRLRDPGLSSRTVSRWFDTSAFALAPQFTLGNSSRNPVVGPPYRTLDLMVGKSFAFGDVLRMELRGEVFNATNTPPLGSPNGQFGTPAFGTITSALDPRVFELVCKLHF